MKFLTRQDIVDILLGCTILGTGGGGRMERGLELVDEALARGLQFNMADINEVPMGSMTACPYYCGSIAPRTPEKEAKYKSLPLAQEIDLFIALKALEKHLGEKIVATVSVEYGGMNTAAAMVAAAWAGIPFVDADAAGRAVPDLQFSTYYVNNISIDPLAVATKFGDVAVFSKIVDDFRAEDLIRALAVESAGMVAMVDHPTRGNVLKKAVIPGALSYAQNVGKACSKAREAGENPIEAICNSGNGKVVFRGRAMEDSKYDDIAGFTVGDIKVEGLNEYKGHTFRVWYKNENMISWMDDEPCITAPELICVLESDTGEPVTNPFCKKDMDVTVVVFPAPEQWRTGKGLGILNPRFFGFDIDPVFIDQR
jgi:DUF917 family protein